MEVLSWLSEHRAVLIGALGVAMSLTTSAHVLLRPMLPRSAAAWLAVIWLSPFVGPIAYVLLGINRIERKGATLRGERRPAHDLGAPPATAAQVAERLGEHAHLVALSGATSQLARVPLLAGNRVEPLVDGDQAFPAMLEAIAQARRSITLQSYIFDADPLGRRFVAALGAAVGRGVEVRVLIDAAGARYHRPRIDRLLRAAGVPTALFLPMTRAFPRYFNLRNHRKVLVVDGTVGFTGGMNLRHHHLLGAAPPEPTRDLHFRVEGPVVTQLQDVFADDWAFTTRERLRGEPWFAPATAAGPVLARALAEGPDDESDPLPWTILTALSLARRRVCVVTPYFLPDPPLAAGLEVAALRGVTVDVVIPERTNFRFVDAAVRGGLWQLLDRDVRIWRSPPPFDHTKLLVVDGAWSLLGSANLDPRSLRLNFELDVEAYCPELGARLEAEVDARLARARRFTRLDLDARSIPRVMVDGAASVLQPYL